MLCTCVLPDNLLLSFPNDFIYSNRTMVLCIKNLPKMFALFLYMFIFLKNTRMNFDYDTWSLIYFTILLAFQQSSNGSKIRSFSFFLHRGQLHQQLRQKRRYLDKCIILQDQQNKHIAFSWFSTGTSKKCGAVELAQWSCNCLLG